jgi:8-oxo-dGTP pyrophosphatase MutT (NUDIX family)
MIEAAGGAVWRRTAKGAVKVLLVHRPRYDDWSFPKGKLDDGESARTAALREVEEETGLRCELGPELLTTRYVDNKGRSKRVRYWVMQPISGDFEENDEVDEIRWCPLDVAAGLLSYEHDVAVVDAVRDLLVPVG